MDDAAQRKLSMLWSAFIRAASKRPANDACPAPLTMASNRRAGARPDVSGMEVFVIVEARSASKQNRSERS